MPLAPSAASAVSVVSRSSCEPTGPGQTRAMYGERRARGSKYVSETVRGTVFGADARRARAADALATVPARARRSRYRARATSIARAREKGFDAHLERRAPAVDTRERRHAAAEWPTPRLCASPA